MLERTRVLILASNQQAAQRYESALRRVGYDVATVSSTTEVSSHFDWGQFAAIIVANSYHQPDQTLVKLGEVLNCPLQTLIPSRN